MGPEENIDALVNRLQGLVKEFGESQHESQMIRAGEGLMHLLETLSSTKLDSANNKSHRIQMHTCGITLWNLSVAMKTGRAMSDQLNAKVRHVACNLTFLANASDTTEVSCRKQLSMALKTGKAWLDCGNATMAESCFILACECWSKLQKLREAKILSGKGVEQDQLQMLECEQNMLKVYAHRAEAAMILSQEIIAVGYIDKAKEMIDKFPKQCIFLATLCYNFGVDSFQKDKFEASISWLRESYEIGKGKNSTGAVTSKMQATTLRLIAMAYVELSGKENNQKALNAIDLSISEESNPRSFYLKLKILLQIDEGPERIKTVLLETLEHPGLKIELGLQVVRLLPQYKMENFVEIALEVLSKKFQKVQDSTKLQYQHLEYLIDEGKSEQAKDLIETSLVKGINQLSHADANVIKKFHLLVWEQASKAFEVEDFKEAMTWYDFSLNCLKTGNQGNKNLAKLQRNRASCFIGMKQYDEATEAINEADKIEPDSPQTHFLQFKVALNSLDDERAISCIEKLGELALEQMNGEIVRGFICLAAQIAFENGNKKVAITTLEKIVQHSKEQQQMLIALRCLTRLRFSFLSPLDKKNDLEIMLKYVKKAFETLKIVTLDKGAKEFEAEITWFVKIAWNLAVTCEDLCEQMYQFFLLCYELSLLLPPGSANASQQKTCLVMAAASGLQSSKELRNEQEKIRLLNDVLDLIHKGEEIYQRLAMSKPGKDKNDPTPSLLVTYEFEAKLRLGSIDADSVIDKANSITNITPKTFEEMAAITFKHDNEKRDVGIKALKSAIKLHLEMLDTDYPQLSKALHSLVSVSLQKGGNSNAESKEEAYQYYQSTLDVIQGPGKGFYPEMEVVWLMTKAWNCGIHLYSAHHFQASEKWCGMAMKLLDQLTSMKSNYETHMTSVYSDILGRIQQSSIRVQVEE